LAVVALDREAARAAVRTAAGRFTALPWLGLRFNDHFANP
jgi:hypothetical protein